MAGLVSLSCGCFAVLVLGQNIEWQLFSAVQRVRRKRRRGRKDCAPPLFQKCIRVPFSVIYFPAKRLIRRDLLKWSWKGNLFNHVVTIMQSFDHAISGGREKMRVQCTHFFNKKQLKRNGGLNF